MVPQNATPLRRVRRTLWATHRVAPTLPAGRVCSVEEADRKLPPVPNEATKKRLSLSGRGRRAAPGEGGSCRRATSGGPRRLSSGPVPGSGDSIAVDRPAAAESLSRVPQRARATVFVAAVFSTGTGMRLERGQAQGLPLHSLHCRCASALALSCHNGPRASRCVSGAMVPHSATPQSCTHGAQRATHRVAPTSPAGRALDRLHHARFRLVRGHGGAVPLRLRVDSPTGRPGGARKTPRLFGTPPR
jgi:hypothetical protein